MSHVSILRQVRLFSLRICLLFLSVAVRFIRTPWFSSTSSTRCSFLNQSRDPPQPLAANTLYLNFKLIDDSARSASSMSRTSRQTFLYVWRSVALPHDFPLCALCLSSCQYHSRSTTFSFITNIIACSASGSFHHP